jgi:hypothetical protein
MWRWLRTGGAGLGTNPVEASTPPKGLNLQNNGSKMLEKKPRETEEKQRQQLSLLTSSYACALSLLLLDARPARAGVRLGGRLLLVFLEA